MIPEALVKRLRELAVYEGAVSHNSTEKALYDAATALESLAARPQTVTEVIDDYLIGLRWTASDAAAHKDKKAQEEANLVIGHIEVLRTLILAGPAQALAARPQTVTEATIYDPVFGDEKMCQCGHTYYRHFDSYEEMKPIGCKYCGCDKFQSTLTARPQTVTEAVLREETEALRKYFDDFDHGQEECEPVIIRTTLGAVNSWCGVIEALQSAFAAAPPPTEQDKQS
jgi:hypothetical protein